ncbi:MAG: HAD family phosphatase [Lachnospiraceae bacterium]
MKKQIKIQTIIFDIGNVLVDFNFSEIFHRYAADEAIYQKIVEATVHSSAWNEFDKGVWSDEKILGAFIQNDPSVEQELRDIFTHLEGMIQQRTETIPWIHALKAQGYQVLYLSNFPQRTYLMNYEAMNFIQEMDGGILSYQEKEIKPEEPIYRLLIEKYNLIPEACVFLDDVENNLVTARKLGMQTILFTNKEEAVAELSKVGVYCKE